MRAKDNLILFLFLLTTLCAKAQDTLTPTGIVNAHWQLPTAGIISEWETNSNALTNSFLLDVRGDQQLRHSSLDNSEKKLKSKNYLVNHIEAGAYYVIPLKKHPNTGIICELQAVSFQNAVFTNTAFEMILQGNAQFANQTKDISKLFYQDLEYQKAALGIRHYFKNKTQCINATLGLIVGDYANQFRVDRGSIFTEQNGEYLDIDLKYERRTSARGARFTNPRGYGAGMNFNYQIYLAKQKATLAFNIRDIGFIKYSAATEHQIIDTAVHYTGVNLGPFSNLESFNSSSLKDSVLKVFNAKYNEESFRFTLPTLFEIRFEKVLNNKSIGYVHVRSYLMYSKPQVKLGYLYSLKSNLQLGAELSAGGFGKMDINLCCRYRASKWVLDASVRSVEGLIAPKISSGLGAFLHLGFYL